MGRLTDDAIACTLGYADLADRQAAWHAVLDGSIEERRETRNGYALRVRGGKDRLSELQRLASLESTCCAWMVIDVSDGDPISLTMTAKNPDGKEIVQLLLPPG